MKWVLQNNIYEEEGFANLLDNLTRFGADVVHVKVVPFAGTLEAVGGEIPPKGADAIVLGSYTLSRVAKEMRWRPGSFLRNLDYRVQLQHWGDMMLNSDAHICEFASVPFQEQPFFLRPVHDTKAFSGLVLDWGQYEQWRDGLLRCPELVDPVYDPLGVNLLLSSTPVMVCKKKEIYNETRLWVVDERVVTSSGYKIGTIKRYRPPKETEPRIIEFVESLNWFPNEAHVMDIADTPDGLKIIEVNNINSAGFYKGDMQKLIAAIDDWANDPSGLLW
jgi:ATP-grasp domain, R2K clade family 3